MPASDLGCAGGQYSMFKPITRLFGSPNQRQTRSATGVLFTALGLFAFVALQKPALRALWYFGVRRPSSCSALLYDAGATAAVNGFLVALLGGVAVMLTVLVDRRISSQQRIRIWYYGRVLLFSIFFTQAAWSTVAVIESKSLPIGTGVFIVLALALALGLIYPVRRRLRLILCHARRRHAGRDGDLRASRGSH
jgi:hypothetical protein